MRTTDRSKRLTSAKAPCQSGLVLGIDASRNRSGGAKAHLLGVLTAADPRQHGIEQVHVWSYTSLLQALPAAPWLVKHNPRALEESLPRQVWWQYWRLPKELRAQGCDILLSTDAGSVCRFSPSIVMSRDMLSFERSEMSRYSRWSAARLRLVLLRYIQASSLRHATAALFLTRYASETIQEYTGPLAARRIIPHGVGEQFRNGHSCRIRADSAQEIRCVYVSNADLYKHQWHVVAAIGELRRRGHPVSLTLVGAGSGPAKKLVADAVHRADPQQRFIEVLDAVPHDAIPVQLARADMFIFASSCENMPNTLVEAMAAGLPIACSRRGPMPEILLDAGAYFDPEDASTIAAAVERLILDSSFRRTAASKARELALQYSWTRCARETWSYIAEVADAATTHAPLSQTVTKTTTYAHQTSGASYRMCSNCIMDTSDPHITFDEQGRCDYCNNFETTIGPNWHTDSRGQAELRRLAEKIARAGKGKDFDCIIGLSGGLDSSYTAYITKNVMNLRPLLFHVDAGWNTDQAVGNIECLVNGLGLDLYTEVIDWEEMKDLQVAFLRSQIPDQDLPQDAAFFSALYKFARRYRIKHVLTGSNFSNECCREPEEWGGFLGIDKLLFNDIHRRFGKRPLETFPLVDILVYKVYYQGILGMEVNKPLNLVPFIKKEAEQELNRRFGWQPFQHKHHESRFTRFYEDYWLPRKFGYQKRRAHFSSLIMTGQMTREAALRRIAKPEMDEHFLKQEFEYVAHKLDLTVDELQAIFDGENKTYRDYRNKRWLIGLGANSMRRLGLERRYFR